TLEFRQRRLPHRGVMHGDENALFKPERFLDQRVRFDFRTERDVKKNRSRRAPFRVLENPLADERAPDRAFGRIQGVALSQEFFPEGVFGFGWLFHAFNRFLISASYPRSVG